MAATTKQFETPETAAQLWRVAESGDINDLRRLLSRIKDVNARNRHGMTALMKAACRGHEPMVRALLEHGADPNLARNDHFTALALAAFFGHSTTVQTLIDHGARIEDVTRCGASARTWATVRTFADVARCLETYKPPPAVMPAVIEKFSVQVKPTLPVKLFAGLLLIIISVGGALMLRRPPKPLEAVPEIPPAPTRTETSVSNPPLEEPVMNDQTNTVVNNNHARSEPDKARLHIRQPKTSIVVSQPPAAVTAAEPAVATPELESAKPPTIVQSTPKPPVSPQLMTPAQKAKVIQWP